MLLLAFEIDNCNQDEKSNVSVYGNNQTLHRYFYSEL